LFEQNVFLVVLTQLAFQNPLGLLGCLARVDGQAELILQFF